MARRTGQGERLRRVSERRRSTDGPRAERNSARTVITASVLAGVSAVTVGLITGLGTTLQDAVTDALSGDGQPAAAAPQDGTSPAPAAPQDGTSPAPAAPRPDPAVPVKVAVIPEEGGPFLVSEHRVTGADTDAVTHGNATQEEWNSLLRKIRATSTHKTAYKIAVTNVSSSTVRVVDIVPVITRRSGALHATRIEPLGGEAEESIEVRLDLDERSPTFTRAGRPYFASTSQVLEAGKGFVMAVEAKLRGEEYVEYHLRVDYIDAKGEQRSLQVKEPNTPVGVFRISGSVDYTEYTDFWGPDEEGRGRRLYTVEERK